MYKKILLILSLVLLVNGIVWAENYRLTEDGVQRLSDTAFIPATITNSDWRDYQDWLSEGNIPEVKLPDPVLVINEDEEKVKAKIWQMAIEALKVTGELPADYK